LYFETAPVADLPPVGHVRASGRFIAEGVFAMSTRLLIFAVMFMSPLLTFTAQASGDPARGGELAIECIDCHGEDGMGNEEYPRISGLEEDYLFEQLMAIKNGERANRAELMIWFLEDLDEKDLADLAAYYASRKVE